MEKGLKQNPSGKCCSSCRPFALLLHQPRCELLGLTLRGNGVVTCLQLRFHAPGVYEELFKRMNPSGCFSRILAWAISILMVLGCVGCGNIFITKHKVLVDAICAPGVEKPSGKSYRLLAKKTVVNQAQVQIPVVKACVDAALSGLGMFEPPANVAPDLFIEVGYGTDTSGRLDPAARETYLQLSARENASHTVDRGTGPEVWDVRVAVLGIAGRVESAMPLLCAVAANYIATDTHIETKVDIPQNSPMIVAVRENAIKSLEAKAPAAAPPPGDTATPSPPSPPPASPQSTKSSASGGAPASAGAAPVSSAK